MTEWVEQLEAGKLPPDFELTEDLLKKMGVPADETSAVLATLKNHRVKTWAALVTIETKAELVEYIGDDKLVGNILWAYLEGYRNKAAELKSLRPSRLEKDYEQPFIWVSAETRHLVPSVAFFVAKQLEAEKQNHTIKNGLAKRTRVEISESYIELSSALFGDSERETIFMRESMRIAVEQICKWLADPKHNRHWLIFGGSRGTGKSVVGVLSAIRLAAEGGIVLYSYKNETVLMFSRALNELEKAIIAIPIPETDVCVLWLNRSLQEAASMYKRLSITLDFIVIEDVGDTELAVGLSNSTARRLIVSSPNASKLERLRKLAGQLWMLILPSWTKEDILAIPNPRVPHNIILERFERFGGIPRWICESPLNHSEDSQDRQISNLSLETLRQVALYTEFCALPTQVDKDHAGKGTDLIFRLEPDGNWPEPRNDKHLVKVQLCSAYVASELAAKFVEVEELNVHSWTAAAKSQPLLATYRGFFLEASVHKAFVKGTVSMIITNISGPVVSTPVRSQEFEFSSTIRYSTIKDKLDVGVYYQPIKRNELAIDSFALVNRDFATRWLPTHPALKDDSVKHFVVFFQVTTSQTHGVDGTYLRSIRTVATRSVGSEKDLPMALIFVTHSGCLTNGQTVTRVENKKSEVETEDGQTATGVSKNSAASKAGAETEDDGAMDKTRKRVPFKDQEQFVQFRAVVCGALERLFERYEATIKVD